jgi:hypothetical protein
MLFDDDLQGHGAAFTAAGAPADLHGTDVGHDAASAITGATIAANDDWLLSTGLHPLDTSLSPPAGSAGSGIAGIAGAATAADHDRMLVMDPVATDPNYWAPPPPKPPIKKVSTISWYQYEDTPLASPPKPS